jgi:DNA-binding Xre family transcriptional regulator
LTGRVEWSSVLAVRHFTYKLLVYYLSTSGLYINHTLNEDITMTTLTLQTLGTRVLEKRGSRGVRETAREIEISHSTLSRVERGFLPDLETFSKICKWLEISPADVLGFASNPSQTICVHFRKDQALAPTTAEALAKMILAAQNALMELEQQGN